jgi:hypothetical protein
MPSRKEAQSGRIEQHGDRCYSSTERAYTTHAGKHYNVATQQINTADASDSINFSARESPAFPRLPYLAYGPSKGSIVNQSHLSLFQRSKSSASLPKVDGFSFGARRDRQMNTRKGRQQQIRPNFRTGKSTQRTQSAEKASEAPRAKYRYVAELSAFGPKLKPCALALYLFSPLSLPNSSSGTQPLHFE